MTRDEKRAWIRLCFVLSVILGGIAKVVVYRRSVPQW